MRIPAYADWGYDAVVPNKTIYVSEGDQKLYQRAQELSGGNLSAAIASALRRYVDIEEGRREGFDEIVVRVGPTKHSRKVRFSGILIGEWLDSSWSKADTFRVYRSRSGKFVLHIERSPEFETLNAEGKPAGWRGAIGLGTFSYKSAPGESTLEVFETVEELRDRIPQQLFDTVSRYGKQPPVEDLDI